MTFDFCSFRVFFWTFGLLRPLDCHVFLSLFSLGLNVREPFWDVVGHTICCDSMTEWASAFHAARLMGPAPSLTTDWPFAF